MPELTRQDVTYFGAGPAGLPTKVLEGKVASALVNYQGLGLGVAEISHRSTEAKEIVDALKDNLATYLSIPGDFEILLMQGGGSGQFAATVQNFCSAWVQRRLLQIEKEGLSESETQKKLQDAVENDLKVDYIVTGSWSQKASEEAVKIYP
jgi:phosphoserine aminotransferase